MEKENYINEISLSSSITEVKKEKDNKIIISENITDENDIKENDSNKNTKKGGNKKNKNKNKDNIKNNNKNKNKTNNKNINKRKQESRANNIINKEEIKSSSDDKFLESIIKETNNEYLEKSGSDDEEDKFINTLDGNDIYPQKNKSFENEKNKLNNEDKNEDEISKNISMNSNSNINKNFQNENDSNSYSNDINNENDNNDNNDKINHNNKEESNYKKTQTQSKDNKNIIQNSESTKINSKKSNTLIYNKKVEPKKMRNIRKIHLNSRSNTDVKKIKIIKSKLISNPEEINEGKNHTIKLNLKLNESKSNELNKEENKISPLSNQFNKDKKNKKIFYNKLIPKKPRLFITKTYSENINYIKSPILSVINNLYFCTKEIIKKDINKNKKNFNNKNNKNVKNKNIKKNVNNNNIDSDKDSFLYEKNKNQFGTNFKEDENKDKEINDENIEYEKKNKQNSPKKTPEMWTELDLDKYRNPSKIRIKINNPFYPLYNLPNKDKQTISLKKINKNKNKFLDSSNIQIKKDSNQELIKLKDRAKLGPLKIKRRTKTNSTSSIYTIKSDHIGGVISDYNNYNYFKNKEIANAIGHKKSRNCQACSLIKNKKINLKSFEPGLNKNNYLSDEKSMKKRKISRNENDNNFYSYNKNTQKMNKNNKTKTNKINQSKISNSSLSTKYANIINIEFPALNSYFH